MITADGWFDWATRKPGPPDKVYSQANSAEWYIPHSAVGYLPGWLQRLYSTDKNPDGSYTDFAAASVHGWLEKDGSFLQHYPITASCWSSGSRIPNTRGIAVEHAGGEPGHESEPFTDAQLAADIRIARELGDFMHRPAGYWRRPANATDQAATLWEHREMTRFGSAATACPSGRVRWAEMLQALNQVGDFVRWGGESNPAFWHGRSVVGTIGWNARQDLKLPAAARSFEAEVWLAAGFLVIHDGQAVGGPEAGHTPAGIWHGRVYLDGAGWCSLDGGQGATIDKLGCLGYYLT